MGICLGAHPLLKALLFSPGGGGNGQIQSRPEETSVPNKKQMGLISASLVIPPSPNRTENSFVDQVKTHGSECHFPWCLPVPAREVMGFSWHERQTLGGHPHLQPGTGPTAGHLLGKPYPYRQSPCGTEEEHVAQCSVG